MVKTNKVEPYSFSSKESKREEIYQIYDRIFKRIFNLSDIAIINLINGIFETNYPLNSKVSFPNKEYVNRNLKRKFADLFIVINGDVYHIEAQMTKDETIVLRAFEYCFYNALENRESDDVLKFPEPVVIYLDDIENVPETSTLTIEFGKQESFVYRVNNFLYQKKEIEELNQKKMVILIPFQLLKLRSLIAKEPSKDNFNKLKKLIAHDILDSIRENLKAGNITESDADQLKELTTQLFDHIYHHYDALGGYEEVRPLLDGAIELPLDKYRYQIDELEQKKAMLEKENSELETEKTNLEIEKTNLEIEKTNLEIEKTNLKQKFSELEEKNLNLETELRKMLQRIEELENR